MIDPHNPGDAVLPCLDQPHLATVITLRADGTPHVVPVGFTYSAPGRVDRGAIEISVERIMGRA